MEHKEQNPSKGDEMKQTIGFCQFCDAFRDADRNENFSYAGKKLLFDYLENFEDETGEEIELDVIALCCDFDERGWLDVARDYPITDCDGDDEEVRDIIREYLEENTLVVGETKEFVIFQSF
jgi:hypothetical protein